MKSQEYTGDSVRIITLNCWKTTLFLMEDWPPIYTQFRELDSEDFEELESISPV